MALLRFQHLGGTLSAADQALIALCDQVAALHGDLETYRQAGFPSTF